MTNDRDPFRALNESLHQRVETELEAERRRRVEAARKKRINDANLQELKLETAARQRREEQAARRKAARRERATSELRQEFRAWVRRNRIPGDTYVLTFRGIARKWEFSHSYTESEQRDWQHIPEVHNYGYINEYGRYINVCNGSVNIRRQATLEELQKLITKLARKHLVSWP